MDDFDSIIADLEGNTHPAPVSAPAFNPSQSYGTPAKLLDNLQATESSGNAYAINPQTKSMGAYQFTPDTVATMHKQGVKFDPFNPQQARAAADWKLSQLAAQNGGDWNKAVAQYGGFVKKDPSSYIGKVMNGVQAPQPVQPPSEFDSIISDLSAPAQKGQSTQPPIPKGQPTQPPADMTITVTPNSHSAVSKQEDIGTVNATALGVAKGAFDTVIEGPAQLAANTVADAYPKNWPGYDFFQRQKKIANQGMQERAENFREATHGHETAAGAGQIGGSVGASLALPLGKLEDGANLVGRLIHAAKVGGVVSIIQPVEDTANYWWDKSKQVAAGAALSVAGAPIAEGAAKVIGSSANAAANLVRPVINRISGLSDDVAAKLATASPELQTAVKQTVAKGWKVNPQALSRQIEADSLPVKISLTPGQATQSPGTISMEQNLRGRNPAMVQKFNDQNSALVKNLEHIRDTGAPDAVAPDHITAGETLIGSLKNVLAAHDSKTSALYKQLTDANGGNIPLDGQSFAIEANKALGQNMKGAFLPTEIQNILSKFQNGEQPMTFENFENLRTILGAAARGAKDGNVKGAVNTVRETLENMPLPPEAQALKPIADAARSSAKQGFDMLKANPALAAIDSGKANADNFVQKYVVNGNKADLINLATTLKDDPVALQTMKAGTVNYLRNQAVGQTGNFSQAAYNNSLQALGPKLDVLFTPQEASQLRTLGNVAKYSQVQPKGAFVNNSNTDVANYARAGASMAAHAVNAATHSPLGSVAQSVIENAIAKKANTTQLRQLLSPAAGTTSPGAAETFLKGRFPAATGRAWSIAAPSVAGQVMDKEPAKRK